MIIWLIGLAGAGKTTLGKELCSKLKEQYAAVLFLDGDIIRQIMGDDLGHSLEDRRENGWRICRLCKYLELQNIIVVCGILSMFEEHQEWNRRNYLRYLEVFLDVPMDILFKRDQKGLYTAARDGKIKNVAGIDLEFFPPKNPDLVLNCGDDNASVSNLLIQIMEKLDKIEQ